MESNEVEKLSVQLTISLEILISHVLTLCALICAPNESIVVELQQSLLHTLKELTKDVVTLWQVRVKHILDQVNVEPINSLCSDHIIMDPNYALLQLLSHNIIKKVSW